MIIHPHETIADATRREHRPLAIDLMVTVQKFLAQATPQDHDSFAALFSKIWDIGEPAGTITRYDRASMQALDPAEPGARVEVLAPSVAVAFEPAMRAKAVVAVRNN